MTCFQVPEKTNKILFHFRLAMLEHMFEGSHLLYTPINGKIKQPDEICKDINRKKQCKSPGIDMTFKLNASKRKTFLKSLLK